MAKMISPRNLELLTKLTKYSITSMDNVMIWGSAAGWASSSLAHLYGIWKNDSYSKDQKKFMYPQEILDAVSNIGLYLGITIPFRNFAGRYVETGKLTTAKIRSALGDEFEYGLKPIDKALKTKFKNGALEEIAYKALISSHNLLKGSVKTLAALGAGLIANNIVTPHVRNNTAVLYQNVVAWMQNKAKDKKGALPTVAPAVNNKPAVTPIIPKPYNTPAGNPYSVFRNGNGGMKI